MIGSEKRPALGTPGLAFWSTMKATKSNDTADRESIDVQQPADPRVAVIKSNIQIINPRDEGNA